MHKKIIAALGVAGFVMLSYVKVNYAMDYEAALAIPEVATQYAEEAEESRLIQKDAVLVMSATMETEKSPEESFEDLDDTMKEDLKEAEETVTHKENEETASRTRVVETAAYETEAAAAQKETESAAPTLSQINSANLQALNLPEYDANAAVSSRVVNISQKEYDILLRIVEAEATGKDVLAKMLVANVIVNRVNSRSFPGSIEEVVFQRNETRAQFSPLDDGRYYTVTVTNGTVEAVNRVLAGEDYSQGALYFAAERVVDGSGCWASRHFSELFRYEGHVFFGPQ